VQSVEVGQVTLTAGNEKLSTGAEQLAHIKLQKEKIHEKLHKQQDAAKDAEKSSTMAVSAPQLRKVSHTE